jgi:ribosomal protein S21
MKRRTIKESRTRILRESLREAMKAGDREAVKRLTKRVVDLIGGGNETPAQARAD